MTVLIVLGIATMCIIFGIALGLLIDKLIITPMAKKIEQEVLLEELKEY